MKKLIAASILLAFLSTAAFAQLKVGFSLDALTDFVQTKSYVDDFNDADKTYLGPGTVDILTNQSYWDDNEMRLNLSYSNDNIKALLQIRGDGLIGNNGAFYTGHTTGTSPTTYPIVTSTDKPVGPASLTQIWGQRFADYMIQGTADKFVIYFGNEAKRGVTNAYRYTHNEFLRNRMNEYGLFIPAYTEGTATKAPSFGFTTYDSNNTAKIDGLNGRPHVDVTYNYAPFAITLAGDLARANAEEGESRIGLMARVSGAKVADMVDFDVTYMIHGGDPTLKASPYLGKPASSDKADGKGFWQNSIGLYAGLSLIDNLGIGIGYTGRFAVQENGVMDESTGKFDDGAKNVHPFFSGIDLRFRYTGIDKLTLTFNNNFSFAAVNGSKDDNMVGIMGGSVGDKEKESWFGMHNALDVAYKVTNALTGQFVIANKAGWYVLDVDGEKYNVTMDQLNILLFASYQFNANVLLESGLMMDLLHGTIKEDDTFKGGTFRFGIPVRVKFTW